MQDQDIFRTFDPLLENEIAKNWNRPWEWEMFSTN